MDDGTAPHRARRFGEGLRTRLDGLSPSARFALTGGALMALAAIGIGSVVASIIAQSATANTASATALFMDSFIAPLAQGLATDDRLTDGPIRAIEELMQGTELGKRVVSVKLWKPDGTVAYADHADLIGQRFALPDGLAEALEGRIAAELDQLDDPESRDEAKIGLPLLEVYSPVRKQWTGEIIAVVEFYENATELTATLRSARLQVGAIVAAAAVVLWLSLFGIVHRASRTIEEQRADLSRKVVETEQVSEQNRSLRLKVERSAARVAELNERFLRRISADLHDGPAQLISLASLRLAGIRRARDAETAAGEEKVVREALNDAMRQIRLISKGLALPEIEAAELPAVITAAIEAHERYSGTLVATALAGDLPPDLPAAQKICVFRFVQEGLSNAYRHGGGEGQTVRARRDDGRLVVEVTNRTGTAVTAARMAEEMTGSSAGAAGPDDRLGIAGLRERLASLGGELDFALDADGMARLAMRLPEKPVTESAV